jgi:DNA-binding MarR family transcriptional regulator
MAIDGRRAGRMIAVWAKRFDLSEPELQLLWCVRQEPGEGCDQTTIARRLALSPAQVSAMVERLRVGGMIVQRLAVGDRRRRLWRLSGDGRVVVERLLDHVEGIDAKPPATGHSKCMTAALVLLAATMFLSGCTRSYYRKQADEEVNCIIDHKSAALGIGPGEFRINVDPRSRMFDPDDPDCPPMPPDDPISHQLMNCGDTRLTRRTPTIQTGNRTSRATTRTRSCSTYRARCRWRCCSRPTTKSSSKRSTCRVSM